MGPRFQHYFCRVRDARVVAAAFARCAIALLGANLFAPLDAIAAPKWIVQLRTSRADFTLTQTPRSLLTDFTSLRARQIDAQTRYAQSLEAQEISEIQAMHLTPTVIVEPPDDWSAELRQAWVDSTLQNPDVLAVEPDAYYHLDAESTPWGVTTIGADRAWTSVSPNVYGAGVKIGVLDSGGSPDHPDLRYAGGYDVTTNSPLVGAWSDTATSCRGHGTHIAGTIAALGNGVGVVGVAPEASLYAVRIFQDIAGFCLALTSSQVAGINWAAAHGIKVINLSIGGPPSPSISAALASAAAQGMIVVVSAGNEASAVGFPARDPNVIAVGSTDSLDNVSSFSNFGPELWITAPGENITSTLPGGTYGNKSGTSMSTPHVVGAIALILAREPTADVTRIKSLLAQSAQDLGPSGRDDLSGWGRVRAPQAITLTQGMPAAIPDVDLSFAERDLATGSGLTTRERGVMDQQGYRNNQLDLGDLLARKRRAP